jgi:peptidoglycan/xylan/chitin deacetylase (PgdA/CDA1 family)
VSALIVTYHGVGGGGGALAVDPKLFAEHLDVLLDEGATFLTVTGLVTRLRAGDLPARAVAITFDDGLDSVREEAAPMLASRGLPATVYCVAGRLGGDSDWPSARSEAPKLRLMSAAELTALARQGFEVGSHGMQHAPLVTGTEASLREEIVDSRLVLEQALDLPVTSFAYPYGAGPSAEARTLVEAAYETACTTAVGEVTPETNVHALPRVDAHYLRRPDLMRRAVNGSLGAYLRARALGAGARRKLIKDYA